ncbi:hypothetical protein DRQ33_04940 [bacterium]|nr:MAG: hypothetical protein DRQ33_04940 [bacterium]
MKKFIPIISFLLMVSTIYSASVGLIPAMVSFDFLPPGYTFDMHKKANEHILIPNDNEIPIRFKVTLQASKAPNSLLPGYENFPDVSWCKIVPDTVTVMPFDTGRVNLVISIPQDSIYLNQYWELGVLVQAEEQLEVESANVKFGIIPSVRGSYLISTLPNGVVNPTPKPTGIVPSAQFITVDDAIEGTELKFKIYNNDTTGHDYVIEPYEFPEFEWYDIRLAIQNTGENKPGKTKWLKVSKGFLFFKKNVVHIEPGEFAEWSVKVKLPNKPEIREAPGWDLVVKILPEGEKAHSGIFRIVIQKEIPK